jgi:ribonuclease III
LSAEELSRIIGYEFAHRELLEEALTHPSALAPEPRRTRHRGSGKRGYERLEFLGDRVLGLVVADCLWHRFEGEPEGDLARRHTHLVRREALVRIAERIGLGRYLLLSRSEAAAGGAGNPGILADACEALIAAIYLDGGFEAASAFVRRFWEQLIEEMEEPPPGASGVRTCGDKRARSCAALHCDGECSRRSCNRDSFFEARCRGEGRRDFARSPFRKAINDARSIG